MLLVLIFQKLSEASSPPPCLVLTKQPFVLGVCIKSLNKVNSHMSSPILKDYLGRVRYIIFKPYLHPKVERLYY